MAFTIDVGYTTDNAYKVDKSYTSLLSEGESVSISPLSTINQLNPTFIIDYDSRLLSANYVVATFLGRKYFIPSGVSIDTAGRMVLACRVDPLSSFDLSNCHVTVTRNGGIGAPTKIPDNKLPVLPNVVDVKSTIANVPIFTDADTENGIELYNYVLIVLNGGANV